jgi:hypothetical protein
VAVAEALGEFENPEEGESSLLEAATKQRLAKTVTDREDQACPIVICEVRRTVKVQSLLVITSSKSSLNLITNPNSIYSLYIT